MDTDRPSAIPSAGDPPPAPADPPPAPADPQATQPWSRDASGTPAGQPVIRLGDYEILETIAQGGMGVVHKARQISLDRIVALKTIRAGQAGSDEDQRRFLSEAAAVGQLDHPHIVPIFQVGRAGGELFYAMGFVEGPSLQRKLESGPLPPREAAACLSKVAAAIAYAHSQGVIHRDLKPSNILIDRDGEPKITDFGLAKQIHHDSSLTATGQVLGTPSFMPPEQASGSGKEVTESADVYSLGATLYCLLTGRPPFAAASPAATLLQVLEQEPPPPRLLTPDVPRDLETICLRCLEKDPRRRYGSATDLKADLDRFLRDEPIRARPASLDERAWRWCRRNPWLATLAAALVVAVIVGVAGIANQWRRTLAEMETNRHRLYAAQMSLSARDLESDNLAPVLARLNAYQTLSGQSDLRSFEWYYLWRECHLDQQTVVVPNKSHLLAASLAPTGKWLAVAELGNGKNFEIQLVDLAQNRIAKSVSSTHEARGADFAKFSRSLKDKPNVTVRYSFRPQLVTFSPDGKWLAAYCDQLHYEHTGGGSGTTGPRRLIIWDVDSARELATLDVDGEVDHIAFSHDRSTLAFVKGHWAETWDTSKIIDGGQLARLAKIDKMSISRLALLPRGDLLVGANLGGPVKLYNTRTGAEIRPLPLPADRFRRGVRSAIDSLVFSTDGKYVAAHSASTNCVTVWEQATGEEVFATDADPRPIFGTKPFETIAFSPDNSRLALACGTIVKVWDVQQQNEIARLRGHTQPIISVAFDGDSQRLLTLAQQSGLGWESPGELKHWDLSGAQSPALGIAGGSKIAISSDGKLLAIPDGPAVHLIDTTSNAEVLTVSTPAPPNQLPSFGNLCRFAALSHDAKKLAILGTATVRTSESGGHSVAHLWIYDLEFQDDKWSAKLLDARNLGHQPAGLAFLADGRIIAASHLRAEIIDPVAKSSHFLPPDRTDIFQEFQDNERVNEMASDSRGDVVVLQVGTEFQVWNAAAGRRVASANYLARPKLPVPLIGFAVSPDGRWLATAHSDRNVRIWDLKRPGRLLVKPALVLAGHNDIVRAITFHPDGKTLLTGGADGLVKVWDLVTGDERLTLRAHDDPVSSLAISADGTTVVSGTSDAGLKIWRAASAAEVQQYQTATVMAE